MYVSRAKEFKAEGTAFRVKSSEQPKSSKKGSVTGAGWEAWGRGKK